MPLPDRLRLHEILLALWEDNGPFARSCLLAIIARVPLKYGPWRALKRIFKEAEARDDTEVFGALAARFDSAYGGRRRTRSARRRWTTCAAAPGDTSGARPGTLPALYADVAADVLAHYADATNWPATWVANHIFFHETGEYDRANFHFKRTSRTRTC